MKLLVKKIDNIRNNNQIIIWLIISDNDKKI